MRPGEIGTTGERAVVVPVAFARKLESELAAMQAERDAAQARELALREALEGAMEILGLEGCHHTANACREAISSPPPPVVTVASAKASIRRYFQACVDAGELDEGTAKYCAGIATNALHLTDEKPTEEGRSKPLSE